MIERIKVVVIEWGVENAGSILNMLMKIGAKVALSTRPEDLWPAKRQILAGGGHIRCRNEGFAGQGLFRRASPAGAASRRPPEEMTKDF